MYIDYIHHLSKSTLKFLDILRISMTMGNLYINCIICYGMTMEINKFWLSLCMQNTLCSSVTHHKTHTSSLNSDILNFPFHKLCSGSFKELFSMHRVHKLADKSKLHC